MNIRKLAVVSALCMSLTIGSSSAFAASFSDTQGITGEESIHKLAALGVFSSTEKFRPEQSLTRGDLSYLLVNVLSLKAPAKAPKITDVPTTNSAYERISKVVGNGYISLKNGKFNANQGVTYGELSIALAYGLGFKAAWSDRQIDTFYFLERKGILSIDTNLDAIVTREDVAIVLDKFLEAKSYYKTDTGVVSELTGDGIVINNGSENAAYKIAGNAALFINGEESAVTMFGAGTAVQVIFNNKGEIAYMNGDILGLLMGSISLNDGKVKIGSAIKNIDLNAYVTPLPNDPDNSFSFTNFGFYSAAGVSFGGSAYINEAKDEVTMLSVYVSKTEEKPFTIDGSTLTVDFSDDGLDDQSFQIAENAKIVLETQADKALTIKELAAYQASNILSGTVDMNEEGFVTAIKAKIEPKKSK
ncbi:hypothetical protein FHS15_002110 [Paenibacillus castaneae]|uniref:S-layer homology domain-containing protein n=1 Tax=Paenibacillus castaneae TaxID=474957 RepID=UPI000C9B6996|nr:S-layer homology domain-containing protein [Paenibacillus castaneae]NIK76985.1 hypothetical protein [Paenibacillus castaneae]